MQEWWVNNDISMYSTNNEGKSVIGERFIKPLKTYKKRQRMMANLIVLTWIE